MNIGSRTCLETGLANLIIPHKLITSKNDSTKYWELDSFVFCWAYVR
jgi:hypothetical protein